MGFCVLETNLVSHLGNRHPKMHQNTLPQAAPHRRNYIHIFWHPIKIHSERMWKGWISAALGISIAEFMASKEVWSKAPNARVLGQAPWGQWQTPDTGATPARNWPQRWQLWQNPNMMNYSPILGMVTIEVLGAINYEPLPNGSCLLESLHVGQINYYQLYENI